MSEPRLPDRNLREDDDELNSQFDSEVFDVFKQQFGVEVPDETTAAPTPPSDEALASVDPAAVTNGECVASETACAAARPSSPTASEFPDYENPMFFPMSPQVGTAAVASASASAESAEEAALGATVTPSCTSRSARGLSRSARNSPRSARGSPLARGAYSQSSSST